MIIYFQISTRVWVVDVVVVQPVVCSWGEGGGRSSNWLIVCVDLVLGF